MAERFEACRGIHDVVTMSWYLRPSGMISFAQRPEMQYDDFIVGGFSECMFLY